MAWRPQSAVELIAGTPAGGGQDRPARVLIAALERLGLVGQPVSLTNIPGKGGGNGWDRLRTHHGDPHWLAINSPTIITNRRLGVSDYDHHALTPITNLYTEYIAFVVRADSPLREAADFSARLARDAAGCRVALATALGNINHMALGRIAAHAGADVRRIPINVFDSALYAVDDVIAGRAEVGAITAVSAVKAMQSGQVRAIAVSAPQRLPALFAAVPTWCEQGIDCVIGTWRGVIAAGGITPEQIAFWTGALRAVSQTAEWNSELQAQYWANTGCDGAELAAMLEHESGVMAQLLGQLGLLPSR